MGCAALLIVLRELVLCLSLVVASCEGIGTANAAVDALLVEARKLMVDNGLDEVPVHDLKRTRYQVVLGLQFFREFNAESGTCFNLTGLKRKGDLQVESLAANSSHASRKVFTLLTTVEGLNCAYMYRPKLFGIGPRLRMDARPTENEIGFRLETQIVGRICYMRVSPGHYTLASIATKTSGLWCLNRFFDAKASELAALCLRDATGYRVQRFLRIALERASFDDQLCRQIHASR